MRQSKVKALRKRLKLKLPVAPDYRVLKKVKKTIKFKDLLGKENAVEVERVVIVNNAKYQYRQIKKIFKGMS